MFLIIAEKAVLAKQIITAIGEKPSWPNKQTTLCGNYLIVSLSGHVIEHLEPSEVDPTYKAWNLESLPIYFNPWPKKVKEDKQDTVANIKALIKNGYKNYPIEAVINAGDMDDEGQLLVDEVLEHIGYTGKVLRLNTADTTPKALLHSLNHLGKNQKEIGDSAEARSISDMVFGYSLSRYYSIKTQTKQAVGRVKCPTLGLVYERDKQIDAFKETVFYTVFFNAVNNKGAAKVKVVLPDDDELLDENGYLTDMNKAIELGQYLTNRVYKGHIEAKEITERPPLPFNLASLQLECEKKYGYSPSQVMEITQKLRDQYNAISYNRSECEYLPDDMFPERFNLARRIAANLKERMPEHLKGFKASTKYRSACFDSSKIQLHFAIVPQDVSVNVATLPEELANVYTEIANRFLMQIAGDCKGQKKSLTIELEKGRKAVSNALMYSDLAWKALAPSRKISEEEKNEICFTNKVDEYALQDGHMTQSKTKPPVRYTQASLIKDMTRISRFVKDEEIKALLLAKDEGKTGDKGSIGTSATRDKIVKELVDMGYLEQKGKSIQTTEMARRFYVMLPDQAKSVDVTARWYAIQSHIAEGAAPMTELPAKVLEDVKTIMELSDKDENLSLKKTNTNEFCKCSCGGTVNRYAKIYKCSHCQNMLYINDNFLKANGSHMTDSIAKNLFESGQSKVKLVSKRTGNKYEALLKVTFDMEKHTPSYELDFPK